MSLAGPANRAGVIAVAYIISYLAMGLPAMTAQSMLLSARRTHHRDTLAAAAPCIATR